MLKLPTGVLRPFKKRVLDRDDRTASKIRILDMYHFIKKDLKNLISTVTARADAIFEEFCAQIYAQYVKKSKEV